MLIEIFFDYCQFYENNNELTVDSITFLNFLNLFYKNRKNVKKLEKNLKIYIYRDWKGMGLKLILKNLYIL